MSTQPKIASYADTEQWSELVIAMHRDQTYNTELGGLFPKDVSPQHMTSVLDVGCGPGGWLLSALKKFPHLRGTGIDTSQLMLENARLLAQAEGVQQAEFTDMDATKALDFPDCSFDFIHIRTLGGFLPREQWPALVQECFRVLRPGGYLSITEIEVVVPASDAADTINILFGKLLYNAGLSFAPTGRNLGLTARLRQMLRQCHFTSIEHKAHGIDVSRDSFAWRGAFEEFIALKQTVFPLFVGMQMITQEELDQLFEQAITDMQEDTYGCMIYLLSVWGRRPQDGDTLS